MNTLNHHGNQAAQSAFGNRYRDQLTLLSIVSALEGAADDIAEGRPVKALDAIRDLSGRVLDDMREGLADHASLMAYRPLHQIDAALHANRRNILEKRAKAEGWRFR